MRSSTRLKKLPAPILSALAMIDIETFPFFIEPINVDEISMIMARLTETGRTSKELKEDMLAIVDGDKTQELFNYVTTYPRYSGSSRVENVIMLFLGFIVAIFFICATLYD